MANFLKNKSAGVISALKDRKSLGGEKKGVKLLGIVKKLAEKRKALKKDGAGGPGYAGKPALSSRAKVPSKLLPPKAKGSPSGRPFVK